MSSSFVASAPAPSAAATARAQEQQQAAAGGGGRAASMKQHRDPSAAQQQQPQADDAGQLVAMAAGPRLNPHSALKEFNAYLLQVLEGNDEEKRQIIGRLRMVVQAQRSAAAVRDDLMQLTMEFNETQRTAEELRLALQESREAQRRLENENRVLAAQVEDDRAKIAALVKLCRAELAAKGGNDEILLQIQSGGRAQAGRGSGRAATSSPTGGAAAGAARGGRGGGGGNNFPVPASKTVSLRAASANAADPQSPSSQQQAPGNSTTVIDGTGAAAPAHFHQQQQQDGTMMMMSANTDDIVAQVLAGPTSANGPGSLVVALRMEADALKQLIDEQRAAYEASRAGHVRVARDCDRRHYEEAQRMAAEIRSLSDLIVTSTKDLCETRQNASVQQRQLRGDIESLVQRLAEAEKSKSTQSARQTEELRVLAVSERNRNSVVTDRLRAKLNNNESKLHTAKDAADKEISHLREALATAQETAARERRLRLRADEHARLKAAGHESDLGLLRAQLRALEKKAFFTHVKDLAEFGAAAPPANAPTEEVEVAAPTDDNEAVEMNIVGGVGGGVGGGGVGGGTRGGMRYQGGQDAAAVIHGGGGGDSGGGAAIPPPATLE